LAPSRAPNFCQLLAVIGYFRSIHIPLLPPLLINDHNLRRSERATRVQSFGIAYAADFAPASRAAGLFLELEPITAGLLEARVGQVRSPLGKQSRCRRQTFSLRSDLRVRVLKISGLSHDIRCMCR
jgi:hypothetical protein